MSNVRLLARVFGTVGWIALVLGVLLVLIFVTQLGSNGLVSTIPILGMAFALALGPFFLWAILTSFCELHEQGQRIVTAIEQSRAQLSAVAATSHASGGSFAPARDAGRVPAALEPSLEPAISSTGESPETTKEVSRPTRSLTWG